MIEFSINKPRFNIIIKKNPMIFSYLGPVKNPSSILVRT